MAKYQPKKGDVVKVVISLGNVVRGIVVRGLNSNRDPFVDVMFENTPKYRAFPDQVTHIDDLNVFDILREKGVLAEKAEEETNG